nr:MAG TPA: hypothetical protein [Caudoviricetes sp.]
MVHQRLPSLKMLIKIIQILLAEILICFLNLPRLI